MASLKYNLILDVLVLFTTNFFFASLWVFLSDSTPVEVISTQNKDIMFFLSLVMIFLIVTEQNENFDVRGLIRFTIYYLGYVLVWKICEILQNDFLQHFALCIILGRSAFDKERNINQLFASWSAIILVYNFVHFSFPLFNAGNMLIQQHPLILNTVLFVSSSELYRIILTI